MSHQLSQSWAVKSADVGGTEALLANRPADHEHWHAGHWGSSSEPYHIQSGGQSECASSVNAELD